MADTNTPFNAVYGVAVGITGTVVLAETTTGAVTSFNGSTGDVTGVSSVEGMTGAVVIPAIDLYLYSIGII
jgi:hypothetical protein